MAKKKNKFKWADMQVFDHQLISNPEKDKFSPQKKKDLVQGKDENDKKDREWWFSWRKN